MATFTLALVYAKTVDNDMDERKFPDRIKAKFIRGLLRKAYRQNESIFEKAKEAICHISKCESEHCDIIKQGDLFSMFFADLLNQCLAMKVNAETRSLLISVCKWLCFIDAVDDFHDDIKDSQYNPFIYSVGEAKQSATEWQTFFASNWKPLTAIYSTLYCEILDTSKRIGNNKLSEMNILNSMHFQQIPQKLLETMRRASTHYE